MNCGSIWSQSFGFDPFGNITKTGSQNFTPTYSNSTNQINGGGYSQGYDANGNLKTINDGTNHTYTWDADGRQLAIDGVSATYDALGRMVELNNSGTYTETVYGLAGEKLALMNAQTLNKSFVAIPSGTAVFNSTGLIYYRHSDWLGSSRFASTVSRTMYSDSAYAPFGEQYVPAGSADQNFTGQQPDTAAGLYDFMFRRLSQIQGRWISPDPSGISAADPASPQTWNRYAYVVNTPVNAVDPQGLVCSAPYGLGDTPCNPYNFGGGGGSGGFDGDSFSYTTWQQQPSGWEPGPNGDGGQWTYGYDITTYIFTNFWTDSGAPGNKVNPWDLRKNVIDLLKAKNDCSDWFNNGQGSAVDIMSHVQIVRGNPSPGPLSPADADTPQGPYGNITVYPDGRFYSDSKSGLKVGGVYEPGSFGARMVILLHELAHKVNLIPRDDVLAPNTPPNQSDLNTTTVMQHCQDTIDSLSH